MVEGIEGGFVADLVLDVGVGVEEELDIGHIDWVGEILVADGFGDGVVPHAGLGLPGVDAVPDVPADHFSVESDGAEVIESIMA